MDNNNKEIRLLQIGVKTICDEEGNKTSEILTLSDDSRKGNTLIYGIKQSGKSQYALPVLFKQDLLNKDAGITVIVDKKDMAYTLYAMAKEAKRKVILLKPSASFAAFHELLNQVSWDYKLISENIIDYKKVIKEKAIVIIDMEYDHYRQNALRATSTLLLQLQTDMTDTDSTLGRRHFVYIDNANRYLPFIELLLASGDTYNLSTTLFMQSRNQTSIYDEDYTALIENNVKNYILMNGINYADTLYWAERLYTDEDRKNKRNFNDVARKLLHREYGVIAYEVLNENCERETGVAKIVGIGSEELNRLKKSAIKFRKKLSKGFKKHYERYLSNAELEKLEALKSNAMNNFDRNTSINTTRGKEAVINSDNPLSFQDAIPESMIVSPSINDIEGGNESSKIEGLLQDSENLDASHSEETCCSSDGLADTDLDQQENDNETELQREDRVKNSEAGEHGEDDFDFDMPGLDDDLDELSGFGNFDPSTEPVFEASNETELDFNPYSTDKEDLDAFIEQERNKAERLSGSSQITQEDEIMLDSLTLGSDELENGQFTLRKIHLQTSMQLRKRRMFEKEYNLLMDSKLKGSK